MKPEKFVPHDSLPDGERLDDEQKDYWGALLNAILSVLAHWRLLVVGPLIAGAIAYAVSFILQKSYVSYTYLGPLEEPASKMAAAVFFSPRVLNAALEKFPQYPSSAMTDDERRLYLSKKIKFRATADPKSAALFVLEVEDNEPARAQGIGATLVAAWMVTTKPPPEKLASLERLNESNDIQLTDLSMAISQLLKHPELLSADVKTGYAPVNIADMIRLRGESVKRSEELKIAIAGFNTDMIFSPPSLPDTPVWPIKRQIVFRTMAITLAALILFVLLRHLMAILMANPVYAPKLEQVRNAMPWQRSPL
jgi:hypothetical protein